MGTNCSVAPSPAGLVRSKASHVLSAFRGGDDLGCRADRIAHVSNKCPLPVFYLTRDGVGFCVRPHRYALAIAGGSVTAGVLGLHECDNPVCVKIAADTDVQQHVVSGSQGDNMERMARMRRGGGRTCGAALRQSRCAARTIGGVTRCGAARLGRRCGAGGAAWRPAHAVVSAASSLRMVDCGVVQVRPGRGYAGRGGGCCRNAELEELKRRLRQSFRWSARPRWRSTAVRGGCTVLASNHTGRAETPAVRAQQMRCCPIVSRYP